MKTLTIHCDFCLKELLTVNLKRFTPKIDKKLMLEHKKDCPLWNDFVATNHLNLGDKNV